MSENNRLTSKDYKNRRSCLLAKITHLENQSKERLAFLAEKHPQATVSAMDGNNIFAKSLTSQYIKTLDWNKTISFIEAIENHIAEIYIQKKLF